MDQAQARTWLTTAVKKARAGLAEGGIPIGAALYGADGTPGTRARRSSASRGRGSSASARTPTSAR
jgi:tRNA(Arg) A34 adenosine deaminase TadA